MGDDPCWHCGTVGLTNDVSGWPGNRVREVPLPPGVMRRPCRDCTFRPGPGTTSRPRWCTFGVWRRGDGTPEPAAYVGSDPVGLMVCRRWWDAAAATALPPSAVRGPVPGVDGGRLVGLPPQSLVRWRRLGDGFPEAVVGDSYAVPEVVEFLVRHRTMRPTPGPLLSLGQMARVAGVRPSTAANWKKRNADFPQPTRWRTPRFPQYDRLEALAWMLRHCHLDRRLDDSDVDDLVDPAARVTA
jgi:hypothetical protein